VVFRLIFLAWRNMSAAGVGSPTDVRSRLLRIPVEQTILGHGCQETSGLLEGIVARSDGVVIASNQAAVVPMLDGPTRWRRGCPIGCDDQMEQGGILETGGR
jgi:hypothetical protein